MENRARKFPSSAHFDNKFAISAGYFLIIVGASMFRNPRILATVIAVLGLLGYASPASAGWVSVKNDTKQTLVLQEIGGPLLRPIRGKCIRLLPGETYREFHALAGEKQIHVFDASDLTKPLLRELLSWKAEDRAYLFGYNGATLLLNGGNPR